MKFNLENCTCNNFDECVICHDNLGDCFDWTCPICIERNLEKIRQNGCFEAPDKCACLGYCICHRNQILDMGYKPPLQTAICKNSKRKES